MHCELKDGKKNAGWPCFRYRDKLKYNLLAPKISVGTWGLGNRLEQMEKHRPKWNKGFWSKSRREIKGDMVRNKGVFDPTIAQSAGAVEYTDCTSTEG